MRFGSVLVASSLAIAIAAHPHPSISVENMTMPVFPLDLFQSAGPAAGNVITKCTRPGVLALAFDDGPHTYTQELVDTLNKANAKGTFFFTGTLYGCIYKEKTAIQNAYKSGHQIASHTWTHPQDFGTLSAADLKTQMTKVENALANIIGRKPTYMRPPYLKTGGSVLPTMKELGYRVITDDIDAGDWNKKTPQQSEQGFTSAGAQGMGHIPLMHEVYDTTVRTLVPWLIDWAKTNKLELVTVADCLGDAGGEYAPGNVTGTGPESC